MLKLKIASGPLAERKRELLRLNQLKLEVDPSCTDGAGTLRLARIIALSEVSRLHYANCICQVTPAVSSTVQGNALQVVQRRTSYISCNHSTSF